MLAFKDPTASYVAKRAAEAAAAGDLLRAIRLTEYLQRLAPNNGWIALELGILRLRNKDLRAGEPFELIARRDDFREAWTGLAAVRLMAGNPAGAAADLATALSRHAPSPEPDIRVCFERIAMEAGAPGWCGMDSTGTVIVSGVQGRRTRFCVLVDGALSTISPVWDPEACLYRFQLGAGWRAARSVAVVARGRPFIGSPLSVQRITRVEGFVACAQGGIEGWCWLPGDPDRVPIVTFGSQTDRRPPLRIAAENPLDMMERFPDFARPRRLSVSTSKLTSLPGLLRVVGPNGQALYGSPLAPGEEALSTAAAAAIVSKFFPAGAGVSSLSHARDVALPRMPSIPVGDALCLAPTRRRLAKDAVGVDVVIPVYRGLDTTLACIDSVHAAQELGERVVVVVDASPDEDLVRALEERAERGEIVLSVQTHNLGFPGAANIGLRRGEGRRDAVLLNSDTLVTPGWLARLRDAVRSAPDIGSATPLSNDATIFSYPRRDTANAFPGLDGARHMAELAAAANSNEVVDVPTAHGFCMYIRAQCLREVGVLREDVFAQGYGEENDWCMRARHLGWRHVAVLGAYVAHVGSQSFAATKTHLGERNIAVLNRLHPGYDALIARWQASNPLGAARQRLDLARWAEACGERETVVFVTHARGGGVKRRVQARVAEVERDGGNTLVLYPTKDADGGYAVTADDGEGSAHPNLRFSLPGEADAFDAFLRASRVRSIEVHHLVGHSSALMEAVHRLGQPYDVVVHDYAMICPRITLTNRDHRYCGEPSVEHCRVCVADYGSNLDEEVDPSDLIARSGRLLAGARTITAPSQDTARRIQRRFPVQVRVGEWEPPLLPRPTLAALPDARRKRRVCVIGAIGPEKGYEVLLDCARFVTARRLPLEFVLVGFSCSDKRLLAHDCFTITGRFEEAEAVALIRAQQADLALLPSQCPETYSYVLSQAWAAGLDVVAFDIGAPAERIRATGWGKVVPLNMTVDLLVPYLLRYDLPGVRLPSARADREALVAI